MLLTLNRDIVTKHLKKAYVKWLSFCDVHE